MRKLVSSITILCCCISFISCNFAESEPCQIKDTTQKIATKKQEVVKESKSVKIDSLEFYCWWWGKEQMGKGLFDDDKQPPKNTYTKMEEWRYGDVNFLHPDKIDIVGNIANNTYLPQELLIEAQISFKVEYWEKVMNTPDNMYALDKIPWSGKVNLERKELLLQPQEKADVTFKDFNLRAVIDKYENDDKNGDLWPWEMKVEIKIKSKDGKKINESEKIIQIVPAD